MAKIRIDAPPRLSDAEAYRYLFRISQDLNLALASVDEGNMTPAAAEKLAAGGSAAKEAKRETEKQAAALKGLIVKTAAEVRQEMDALEVRLNGKYAAQGDFGKYAQDTQTVIEALPESVTQYILQTNEIQGMAGAIEGLKSYRTETEGFIKSGVVGVKADGVTPEIGIAIGQNIETTGSKARVEDADYDVIKSGQTLAAYTSEGLSFYLSGTRVAYLTNRRLYILDAVVSGSIRRAEWLWERDGVNGLTLRYVG